MCGGTDSAATVKGNTTAAQDNTQREKNVQRWRDEWQRYGVQNPDPTKPSPDGTPGPEQAPQGRDPMRHGLLTDLSEQPAPTGSVDAHRFTENQREMQGFSQKPPPDPDMADDLLRMRKRRASEATSLLLARGRKSTMTASTWGSESFGKRK